MCKGGAELLSLQTKLDVLLLERKTLGETAQKETADQAAEKGEVISELTKLLGLISSAAETQALSDQEHAATQAESLNLAVAERHRVGVAQSEHTAKEVVKLEAELTEAHTSVAGVGQQVSDLADGGARGEDTRTPAQMLCNILQAQMRVLGRHKQEAYLQTWTEAMVLFLPQALRSEVPHAPTVSEWGAEIGHDCTAGFICVGVDYCKNLLKSSDTVSCGWVEVSVLKRQCIDAEQTIKNMHK